MSETVSWQMCFYYMPHTHRDKVKQFPRNPVFVTFIDHQLVIDWVNQRCFGHDLFLHLSFLIFIVLTFEFKFKSSSPLTINHSYKSPADTRAGHKKPQFHACTFILPLFCNLSVVKRFHLGSEYSLREIEVILRLSPHYREYYHYHYYILLSELLYLSFWEYITRGSFSD